MNDKVTQYSICYRPRTWEEVYGQETTVRELRNRVLNNNFPKVTLFQGPYGTGKTTLAHIFAACIFCFGILLSINKLINIFYYNLIVAIFVINGLSRCK